MSSEAEKPDDETARARARALLEATHQFPCHYAVTVIAFNREGLSEAVREAARPPGAAAKSDESLGGPEAAGEVDDVIIGYEARASKEGKYLSHRFAVRVVDAGQVLELYARLRSLDGVVTLL